jgi:hypothetical protein
MVSSFRTARAVVMMFAMLELIRTGAMGVQTEVNLLDAVGDGRDPAFVAGARVGGSGGMKTTKKERRLYQATQLLDQLLTGYDRRLRPGFRGQLSHVNVTPHDHCFTKNQFVSAVYMCRLFRQKAPQNVFAHRPRMQLALKTAYVFAAKTDNK